MPSIGKDPGVCNGPHLLYDSEMKVYLARHTQTNYNARGLCNADPTVDVHLTSTGIEQATKLAESLKPVRFDHIFISELKRTQQTAEIINTFHNVKIEVDSRLNDIRSGFEGKPFADYVKALDAAKDRWTARLNGGESIEDSKKRAAEFIHDLQTKHFEVVLVVTSEWIIRAILATRQKITNQDTSNLMIIQGGYVVLDI